jgi:trehalose/maltose transport system substrate-binding protein
MKCISFLQWLVAGVGAALIGGAVQATELTVATGDGGRYPEVLRQQLDRFEAKTGYKVKILSTPVSGTETFGEFRLWLAAGNADIDVYLLSDEWVPQLADHFLDLSKAAAGVVGEHFPLLIEGETIGGRLVGMPLFADAPALFYRADLLKKYGKPVPSTWAELATTAKEVMDGERAAGNARLWGFVFQGDAYEGLTCDALEWVASNGGGRIVEPDGTISVDNEMAVAAINRAAGWIGTIAPEGVLGYKEEESRGVWQLGNAVFMRNWPYAYALGNSGDSAIKGQFDVAPLPKGEAQAGRSAATLASRATAASKYSRNPDAAIQLAMFLSAPEQQKENAIKLAYLPTIKSLYDDPEIAAAQPIIPRWREIFLNAVWRPAVVARGNYNEVSSLFWTAVHKTLSGDGSAAENLKVLKANLTRLKGAGW